MRNGAEQIGFIGREVSFGLGFEHHQEIDKVFRGVVIRFYFRLAGDRNFAHGGHGLGRQHLHEHGESG